VPKQLLGIGGKHALLCEMRHLDAERRDQRVLSTGLFFSSDLMSWQEHRGNPVFAGGNAFRWQNNRAMGEWLARDEQADEWLLFFCGSSSKDAGTSGERVVGVARSPDLRRWTIHPSPVVTIDSTAVTSWKPKGADRVYCRGVHHVDGWWHMMLNCGSKGGPYISGVVIARRPEGPWLDPGQNPVFEGTLQSPLRHGDRWYATQSTTSERTVGLAWSRSLTGAWVIANGPGADWIVLGGCRDQPEGIWISQSIANAEI